MNCISFTPNDHRYLREHPNDWFCKTCITCIFQFSCIDDEFDDDDFDDDEFAAAINRINTPLSLNNSGLIFHPIEMNDTDHNSTDTDLCLYNSKDFDLSHCNKYGEDGFLEIIKRKKVPINCFPCPIWTLEVWSTTYLNLKYNLKFRIQFLHRYVFWNLGPPFTNMV